MTTHDWTASWIWGGGESSPRNEWRCFRKQFECPADFAGQAQVRLCADSRYVLYVNGMRVGRGPVRSWPHEQFYDTYEIGHLLRPGAVNTLAILVLHFGVANFYYIRGRGGLLAEVAAGDVALAATDGEWRTRPLAGFSRAAPRMSCQQGFSEIIDAREEDGDWSGEGYDDSAWERAVVIGPVGTAPWTKLVPRDIPYLTEEKLYPAAILEVNRVETPAFMAAIDMRNQFVPESADHANPIRYCGYLATVLRLERAGTVTVGLPTGLPSGSFYVGGVAVKEWRGEQPEQYAELALPAGDHLLLLDATASNHGGSFHFGLDADAPFSLRSPLGELEAGAGTPFATYGPFDHVEYIDHQGARELSCDHADYLALAAVSSAAELEAYREWARPLDPGMYTEADVFGLSVWRTRVERKPVAPELVRAVLPVPEPAALPRFDVGDCELVIDLGKEQSGFIGFEIEAPAGTILDLYGVEYRRDDYTQHTYGLDNTLRYVCREGRQRYLSPVRRGLRYLIATVRSAAGGDPSADVSNNVSGNASGKREPVKLHEIYIHQSNYPVANQGTFRCSDPLLNDIWEISRHTTRLCMEDTFVDCPAYEQVFWVGDARNEALVNYYVFGATDIVKRCLNLVPGSSEMTPLYVDQVPSAWSSVIPNWTFFWVIACEEFIGHTGDRAFAQRIWPAVRHTLVHYLTHLDKDGLLNMKGWNLLDWAPIDQPNDGIVTHQNLFLVKALRKAAAIAEAAGLAHEAEEAGFAASSDSLAEAINGRLWDDTRRAYLDCIHPDGRRSDIFSMQTQVVAYLCEVAEGERRATIDGYLAAPPAEFVQIGSPFMSFFYYEALVRSGRHAQILADIRRNYGAMIEHEATTCWEMYPNFAENRANPKQLTRSHCHAWSAAPGYFLGASALGVNRKDAGWQTVEIAPQPSDLAWASGSVPLPQGGHIGVRWTRSDARMKLRVEHPREVSVNVVWPEGLEGELEEVVY
ncbi:family 78 glycoside hydrolase catalytic domain [Cohnella fermenti]|uniref:Alpha-L-rhamnosidase n=1 Tax=Cohnella fermenti TaxID=2565925 RepID=A0A4S4C910_9BACL|nr:family 78 glycoside hydrolase catalytic domain [Cohnella fermenti]THF84511.1 alpha-L-rhamnosidase [Cohnella fermenti]